LHVGVKMIRAQGLAFLAAKTGKTAGDDKRGALRVF
jgi:hypothetical protein